jgi:DNA polymerase I-like protein with 3'-5' exonuclease and polymerase domains
VAVVKIYFIFPAFPTQHLQSICKFLTQIRYFEGNLAFFPIFRMSFNSPIQFADQDECRFLMIQIDNSLQSLFKLEF